MDKLKFEPWSVTEIVDWLTPPYVQLGYLSVPDSDSGNIDTGGRIQELESPLYHDPEDEAVKEASGACRSAAEQGDALAQFRLGVVHAFGQGQPRDYPEAAKWWRKAAERDYALAEYNLGLMYMAGKGIPQNETEGAKWLSKAADQRIAAAQYDLGRMYSIGLGVPYDLIQAHMWLNLAGAQGYGDAIKERDIVAVWIGSATEIAEAEQLAAQWSPTGARLAGEYQLRP